MGHFTVGGAVRSVLAAGLCAAAFGSITASAQAGGLYVALGDSYTAGPLVAGTYSAPYSCLRSSGNYPNLVAKSLGYTLRDVSCSGATTRTMFEPHGLTFNEVNPPQLDGVTADAKLVTVQIGGNDAGLVGVGIQCGVVGYSDPFGKACRNYYNQTGTDVVQADINQAAPKVAAVIQAIHARAPLARVAVLGYPAVAPHDGKGCYPLIPMSADDLKYVDELLIKINVMISAQAAANNATYVDVYTPSLGHDVCKLPGVKWFEGLVPTGAGAPLHPNTQGEASMAASTVATLQPGAPAPAGPIRTVVRGVLGLVGLG